VSGEMQEERRGEGRGGLRVVKMEKERRGL
jgi:hypothetical protein